MIKIKSYIEVENGFVPINEFYGKLSDDFYIYGAIELNINNIKIIDLDMFDLVDQLWKYIINGIIEIENGTIEYNTSFPDQPLPMYFKLDKKTNFITITTEPRFDKREASINYNEFVLAIINSAKYFFNELFRINKDENKIYIEKINQLEKKYLKKS